MSKSKSPPEVRIHAEPATEIDEAVLNLFCRIAFGMNTEQTVAAVRKNAGGRYDELYERGDLK